MSGPSLKKPDAHSSIHEAALNEARELREIFQRCLKDGQKEKALQVAEVIIEHWETRTLKHAESEEEGLYKEMVLENAQLKDLVVQLTRDHDIMRRIVQQMKEKLQKQEIDEEFTRLMDGVIIVDLIHNEDEMNKLLPNSKH
ncbi:hemerythrin domain-containing protein [Cytobacillus sp.]|uniref:hemerythrin domain-containing protein n=1 Tax=Cytobacillus sp. TaxID=2675269 RepID=UPI0028BDE1D9|nr:hemerythrin domain-containing protein [Cytobacillus sp.]